MSPLAMGGIGFAVLTFGAVLLFQKARMAVVGSPELLIVMGALVGMIMKGGKGLNPKVVQERLRAKLG